VRTRLRPVVQPAGFRCHRHGPEPPVGW